MLSLSYKDILQDRFSANSSEELFNMVNPPEETCPDIDYIQDYIKDLAIYLLNEDRLSSRNSRFLYAVAYSQLESLRSLIIEFRNETRYLKHQIWEYGVDPNQAYFKDKINLHLHNLKLLSKKLLKVIKIIHIKEQNL